MIEKNLEEIQNPSVFNIKLELLTVSIHLQDAQDIAFFEEQLSKAPDF